MGDEPEGPVEDWTLDELVTVASVCPHPIRREAVQELKRRAGEVQNGRVGEALEQAVKDFDRKADEREVEEGMRRDMEKDVERAFAPDRPAPEDPDRGERWNFTVDDLECRADAIRYHGDFRAGEQTAAMLAWAADRLRRSRPSSGDGEADGDYCDECAAVVRDLESGEWWAMPAFLMRGDKLGPFDSRQEAVQAVNDAGKEPRAAAHQEGGEVSDVE